MDDYSVLIKELRKKMLVTQVELADILGVSFASINRYENGHNVSIKVKRKLRDLFIKYGVKVED